MITPHCRGRLGMGGENFPSPDSQEALAPSDQQVDNQGFLKKPDPLRGNWFQRPKPDKLAVIVANDDCHNC